ncbi:MAG TPA: discoidin domain-containing protein, partial [Kiritimatiellia bacterium]|nr:discoidin domain-containing protein [Kiritimatiellia bacterium]
DLSDAATAAANGQRRADKDYAVSWIRPYGKGRVFYTSFGHDQRAFLDKAVVVHILDGIQYAIGDLKADDAPGGLSESDLARVRGASDEHANEVFAFLQDTVAHTYHARTASANRAKLEALLKDPTTSTHGKRVILRIMLSMGAPADLDPVAACLLPPETRDWAAALLAGTPGNAAAQSLARALQNPDPALRLTVLNALAIRRDAAAVAPLAADRDPAVAAAAFAALGRIGDEEALKTLVKPAAAAHEPARLRALAACLGTLGDQGQARAAVRAAKPIFTESSHPGAVRAAAARVLLLADRRFFEFGMKDVSPLVRQTVIRAADDVPVNVLADALKTAAPSEQAMLAAKLASRGDAAAADAVAALLASDQDAVAVAALQALTRLGTGRHVSAIAALIGHEGAVGRSAVETLQDMRAKDAGAALFALAEREPDRQAKLLPVLGERMESALLPRFAPFVTSDRAEVRREAWKALGKAADERNCGTLLAWLPQIREEELNQAEAAVRAAAKNLEPAARTSSFVAAWGKSGPVAKRALASLMTGYSDPAFMAPLTGALAAPEASVRETALRQLGEWPSMEPFAALKAAVAAQGDAALKQVALRSALKLAAAQGGAGARDRFVELFKVAPDDKGRHSVADAVFRRDGIDLFPLLRGLFDDAACGGAAKALYRRFYDEKLKQQAAQPLREIAPGKWKANASHAGRDAARAFDRKPETRWSSNRGSEKGMWFTLDLGESVFVSEVVLDTERSGNDTPNGYEVFVSADGKAWTGPVAKGDGNHSKKTVIPLSVQTSHLKIVTTGGRGGLHWSIHEITVKAGLDQKKVDEIRAVADAIR